MKAFPVSYWMERIYIKPKSQEIVIQPDTPGSILDTFSYEPPLSDQARKLGDLFIVGHVKHATDDVGYMINLIAALAKREFYSNPNLAPKDAFAATLKKINEVVREFFQRKDLEANIGVFSITNDSIYISRLGKFKVILARGGKNIDVLNNVELFEKDHIQENEFSNIISGKIKERDRLLAFYPGQHISSRERYVKADFLKLTQDKFIDKIKLLKEKNEQFACALLYVNLKKIKESAVIPKTEIPEAVHAQLASTEKKSQPQTETLMKRVGKVPENIDTNKTSFEKNSDKQDKVPQQKAPSQEEPSAIPRIIPSEFSLGKRDNTFATFLRRIGVPRFRIASHKRTTGIILASIVGTALLLSAVLILAPQLSGENRKIRTSLEIIDETITNARNAIAQNHGTDMRPALISSLAELTALPGNGDVTERIRTTQSLLDTIDKAQDAAPSLFYELNNEYGILSLLNPRKDDIYIYAKTPDGGTVLSIADGAVSGSSEVKDAKTPKFLFSAPDGKVLLVDAIEKQLILLHSGKTEFSQYEKNIVDVTEYAGNAYVLESNNIAKVNDALLGGITVTQWLKESVTIYGNPVAIAVDGNIYVITDEGKLLTYYKGELESEDTTGLMPSNESRLLMIEESEFIYLVDKTVKSVFKLRKETGELEKTFRINGEHDIIDIAMSPDEVFYFATADNKIWSFR